MSFLPPASLSLPVASQIVPGGAPKLPSEQAVLVFPAQPNIRFGDTVRKQLDEEAFLAQFFGRGHRAPGHAAAL
jgi:hypothetical protein